MDRSVAPASLLTDASAEEAEDRTSETDPAADREQSAGAPTRLPVSAADDDRTAALADRIDGLDD